MLGRVLFWLCLLVLTAGAEPNRVLRPAQPAADPLPPGEMQFCSWNLHHFRGPTRQGAPQQGEQMLDELRGRGCEVVLLQEVPADQAQRVADRLGMVAYLAETLPGQAMMLLVHPDLRVLHQERVWVYGDESFLPRHAQAEPPERQLLEPRSLQLVRLTTPDGQELLFWNTHLTSGPDALYASHRRAQLELCLKYHRGVVLGGGDLNSEEPAEELRQRGYQLGGLRLDWLTALGPGRLETTVLDRLRDRNDDEVRLSDHPLVLANYRF